MSQAPEQMDVDNSADASVQSTSKKSNLPELLDASSPVVQDKYKTAGTIANTVLYQLIKSCSPGVSVVELCKLGDTMIESEASKVYPSLKSRGQKGVAFPTCISINEVAGHYSPFSDDTKTLRVGDMVKLDLGVHIDGFTALAAHTIVLGEIKERKADVIAATWSAAQLALRLLKPKIKNSQLTAGVTKCAEAFKCEPMESVLSHEMRQYVLDHENAILLKTTPERRVNEFEFDNFQVFGIDIMMSTGRGKAIERGEKCTIYKRNVEVDVLNLKLQTSKDLIRVVNKNHPTFPFTLRNYETERFRFGVNECKNHALVQPYPVLSEKIGEYVAQFKFTAIVTPQGPIQLCGLPLDMSKVFPQHQIQDGELQTSLGGSFNGKLPAFFQEPQLPQFVEPEEKTENKPQKKGQEGGQKNNNKGNKNNNKGNKNNNKGNKNTNNQSNQKNQNNQNKKQANAKKGGSAPNKNTAPKSSAMDID